MYNTGTHYIISQLVLAQELLLLSGGRLPLKLARFKTLSGHWGPTVFKRGQLHLWRLMFHMALSFHVLRRCVSLSFTECTSLEQAPRAYDTRVVASLGQSTPPPRTPDNIRLTIFPILHLNQYIDAYNSALGRLTETTNLHFVVLELYL